MTDSIHLQKEKEYVNFREFRKLTKSKWGLSKAEAKAEWSTMLSDPSMPKATDQRGWLTMPAISQFKHHSQKKLTGSMQAVGSSRTTSHWCTSTKAERWTTNVDLG